MTATIIIEIYCKLYFTTISFVSEEIRFVSKFHLVERRHQRFSCCNVSPTVLYNAFYRQNAISKVNLYAKKSLFFVRRLRSMNLPRTLLYLYKIAYKTSLYLNRRHPDARTNRQGVQDGSERSPRGESSRLSFDIDVEPLSVSRTYVRV